MAALAPTPRGIVYILLATLLFSCMDVLVKLASESYPVGQIVFFRNLFAFLPLSFFVARGGGLAVLRTRRLGDHLWRSLTGLSAMVAFFLAFALLPLGEAVALGQAGPIFLTALSVPLLKEKVGPRRWSAVVVGFLGVLVMTRPGSGVFNPAALVPIAGALLYALAMISIRRLGSTEPAPTIVFYFTLFATLGGALSLPFQWHTPDAAGLSILVSIGLIGGLAQMAMTQGFRLAPVAVVAPFEYSSLVFAVGFGYLIWGDFPGLAVLGGAALVVASGLYILHRETILARAARAKREGPPRSS